MGALESAWTRSARSLADRRAFTLWAGPEVRVVPDREPIAVLEDVRIRYDREHIETADLELYEGWVRLTDGKWIPREDIQSIDENP